MPDSKTYDKAIKHGDEIFALVGQDRSSPQTICEWIKLNIETAPPGKLFGALDIALRMTRRTERKAAD